ncbi:hypothetical protein Tco_1256844 [Tanacetum coccineum]
MVSPINTQSISNNIVPSVNEASSSHNVFDERLENAYFDARTKSRESKKTGSSIECSRVVMSQRGSANVAEALKDADWVSAMQDELDQFARLKVWRLVPRHEEDYH